MDVRERPEARSSMVRNSKERLGGRYDPEPRESAASCTSLTRSGIMLIIKVGVLIDPLYWCTAVHYLPVFSLADCALVHIDLNVCVS